MSLSTMNLLKIHGFRPQFSPLFKSPSFPTLPYPLRFPLSTSHAFSSPSSFSLSPFPRNSFTCSSLSGTLPSFPGDRLQRDDDATELDYLARDGVVFQNTLRLVECSMFAAVTGLIYFLSNSLSIENYFGCFFSLPIVVSSMRWGVGAGRKTMVATAMLLFVLSGPLKALTYLLTHGIVGFTMGSLWRLGANWRLSVVLCTLVMFVTFDLILLKSCLMDFEIGIYPYIQLLKIQARAAGAMGYVFTSSFLIRENILALITVNIHASLTLIFAALGINIIPSMNVIYTIFGVLVLLNSGFFVFLLHLLYAVLLTRLGMRDALRLPGWLDRAL